MTNTPPSSDEILQRLDEIFQRLDELPDSILKETEQEISERITETQDDVQRQYLEFLIAMKKFQRNNS